MAHFKTVSKEKHKMQPINWNLQDTWVLMMRDTTSDESTGIILQNKMIQT